MDAVIEGLPHFIAATISAVKILNVYFYRENVSNFFNYRKEFFLRIIYFFKKYIIFQFDKLFQFVTNEWNKLKLNNELHILDKTIIRGNRTAHLYRSIL